LVDSAVRAEIMQVTLNHM